LDRSFTQGLASNSATTAIVRSVIGLGHELGIRITAEGVETPEQQLWLTEAGCDRLQGYLFSRPLPPAEFAASYLA
ncbi:EAL domain-containing protein, partial [Aeromonas sp. CPF2-S1]|nr:EAL domain-containing protein [Aeromonas sp. CPF2-S1]